MAEGNSDLPWPLNRHDSLIPPGTFSRIRGENAGSAPPAVPNILNFRLHNDLARNSTSLNVDRYEQFSHFRRHLNIPVSSAEQLDEEQNNRTPSVTPDLMSPSSTNSPPKKKKKKKGAKKDGDKKKEKPDEEKKKDGEKKKKDEDDDVPPGFRWVHLVIE